MAWFQ